MNDKSPLKSSAGGTIIFFLLLFAIIALAFWLHENKPAGVAPHSTPVNPGLRNAVPESPAPGARKRQP